MTNRVTDAAVDTVVGTLERAGGTRRLELRLPVDADGEFPAGELVRVVIDGSEHRTELHATGSSDPVICGVYDTPRQVRTPGDRSDRLTEWADDRGLDAGRSVHVDVVEPGFKYGLRAPGDSATYAATEPPDDGLSDIARSLEE